MALPTIGLLIDWLDNDYADSQAFAFHDEVCGRGFRFLCFVGHRLSPPGEPEDPSNLAFRLATARALDALPTPRSRLLAVRSMKRSASSARF